jgi:pyruvate/2-oxoglutarate dehydrogenase complex dihydrolipoamide dehydrogenase (E3) component
VTAYDAIIVGAGQAGPPLAARLTGAGMKVALVERKLVGGTCVNTGCTPTKALVASAYAAHLARRADLGVVVPGEVRVDFPRAMARAQLVSEDSRKGVERWLAGMEGLRLVRGQARFEDAHTVRVGEESLTAPRIFLNVGGRAAIPDMPGVADVPFLTNTSILALHRLPRHLVVIGGSYVGLEFAQVHRRFGAEVTVVEKGPRLVGREDEDVSQAVREILESEGIRVRTQAECIGFARHRDGVLVSLDCSVGPPAVVGSDLLLAVGRRPNTDDLDLERAGIVTDGRGYIRVDESLATTAPGVWALGDCNGRGAFTHTSWNDYEIVAANLLEGAHRQVKERVPGYALYIDPPLGRAGMTEAEARAGGRRVLIGKRPMTRVSRAVEKGETAGFMKVVADADSGRILGAAILGTGGDEAIHGLLDAIHAGISREVLRWAVPIHPTVSELIPTVLQEMKPADRG